MSVRFYFTLIARSRTHQHHADSSIAAHLRYADRKEHIESQYAPLHSATIDSLPPSPSRMPQNSTWPFFYIKPFYTKASTLIIKHKEFYLQKTWQKFCRFKNLSYLCNR